MKLMREIRCFPNGDAGNAAVLNSWAGSPGEDGAVPFWVLRATVEGPVDQQTGYLCDIKQVDATLREVVVPRLRERVDVSSGGVENIASGLIDAFPRAAKRCPANVHLTSLEWAVSPYLRFAVRFGDLDMVHVTQSFEFSAAHRLYCEELSDEENGRIFGKCSNPNGHGHNYVVDVTVSGKPDDDCGTIVDLPQLQRVVNERAIRRFDHKHLNLDCAEFESLNPSVENIARVIWGCLDGAFGRGQLTTVRVWETPKTYAEYNGA